MKSRNLLAGVMLVAGGMLLAPGRLHATPAFARQLNVQCTACHTEFPVLNDFGRFFKLSGYTMSAEQSQLPPVAIMLQPGFTHTQAGIAGGAAPGFHDNDNFALGTVSLFYTGRLLGPYAKPLFGDAVGNALNKIGVFYQHTWDGVAHHWSWDNVDIRYADTGTMFGKQANYGFYANNNPTMQDPWHTLPAWSFPFNTSPLASTPAAATLVDGVLSQQVVGFGAYALVDSKWYADVALYHTLGTGFQRFMGIDPADQTQVPGVAPYWRLAYTRHDETATSSWMVGTFGMMADTYPARIDTNGKDRFLDLGVDAQYQTAFGGNDLAAMVALIHENQWWDASLPLGFASNASDTLWKATATAHLLHDKTYGLGFQYFAMDGSKDASLYADSANGSPFSDGFVFEASWLPLNKSGGPDYFKHVNVKFTVQYILYNHFNGGRSNYDGLGGRASDNNTLFVGAWIAF